MIDSFTGRVLVLFCAVVALPELARPSTSHLKAAIELINQGNLDGAEKEARVALKEAENRAAAWGILGSIRVQQNQYDEGVEFLRKAINLNPRMVGARVTLGGVYIIQGKRGEARTMFREALRLDPNNFNGRLDLAQLESAEGNYQASMETAKPIISELHHSPDGLFLLATNFSGLLKKQPLAALAPDWCTLQDPAPTLTASFASLLIKNGLGHEGIEIVQKAQAAIPNSFDLTFALAVGYSSIGDTKQASQNYEVALTLRADCVPCLAEIARIADQDGNSEKALAYLIRSKEIEPENPEILFAFGKICLKRDLNDDAIGALTKAASLRPGNDSYVYVLAAAHVARKEYKDAQDLLENLLKKHPSDAYLHYGLGSVLFLEQDLDLAEQHLKKSIQLQPNQRAAYYYLGLVSEGLDNNKQAIKILQDLRHRFPDYALAYEALGTILLKEKNFPQAREMLEKAVQLNANSVKAHYQLGMLLGRIGREDESHTQLEIARKLETDERAKNELQLHILMPE